MAAAAGGGPSCISRRPPPHTILDSLSSSIISIPLHSPRLPAASSSSSAFAYFWNPLRAKKIIIERQHLCPTLVDRLQRRWNAPSFLRFPGQLSDSWSIDSPRTLAAQEMKSSDYEATRTSLLKFGKGSSFAGMVKDTSLAMRLCAISCGSISWSSFIQEAQASQGGKIDMVYEIGELFELGIQLSYLLVLLGLLGAGSFFVVRQVLLRRELDLSAKELQEQVRSGDATATEYFELGAVMLRRKFYPAAIKYLQQAIEKWDRDEQDLAQVYNALGVSYVRDDKLDKAISQFEKAVKLQPGYVTAWNNLGDAYEKKKDLRAALKAFEEVLLFDPNNKIARPRRDALRERVRLYKGVPLKSEDR